MGIVLGDPAVIGSHGILLVDRHLTLVTGRLDHDRQQKGSRSCLFSRIASLLDPRAVLVGACVDFDFVADFNKRRNRQFEAGGQTGWLHYLA